ncbi:MAG: hypothetical protein CMQ34_07335 [Gammaproteobacteria bacterium]|nr:hypothetical protein [Gammaproteobacteria bacterium]|tara:strand:+ start:1236 stop:1589 length:354 start_codon:yes stop_codon:yes gene_type:complete
MIRFFALILVAATMTGCLFVVDSRESIGDQQWSEAELDRVTVGSTDAAWIRSNFGSPDRVSTYDNGMEVWRYRNTSESESEIGLFLLFNINVERESAETLALEIRDGVVTDYWVEKR